MGGGWRAPGQRSRSPHCNQSNAGANLRQCVQRRRPRVRIPGLRAGDGRLAACFCHGRKLQSTRDLTCAWLGGLRPSLISGPRELSTAYLPTYRTVVGVACHVPVDCRCPSHAPQPITRRTVQQLLTTRNSHRASLYQRWCFLCCNVRAVFRQLSALRTNTAMPRSSVYHAFLYRRAAQRPRFLQAQAPSDRP